MIRFFDLTISLVFLILFSPILVISALMVLIEDGIPILYVQKRVGLNEKGFHLIKFRSMINNSKTKDMNVLDYSSMTRDELKKMRTTFRTTVKNDDRITKVGKFIRKYSIDELPQLINVIMGDMSLVGPRPDLPIQKVDYTEEDWNQRNNVKPGLTGYAQIGGRSNAGAKKRIEMDLLWVKERNTFNYFKVLLLTPFKLFQGVN